MCGESWRGAPADKATAAANTAVVITYAAETGRGHEVAGVYPSYSAAPTGGGLTIEDGAGTVIFDKDITVAEVAPILFDPPISGRPGQAMIVTLKAGSGTVVGKLNIRHRNGGA